MPAGYPGCRSRDPDAGSFAVPGGTARLDTGAGLVDSRCACSRTGSGSSAIVPSGPSPAVNAGVPSSNRNDRHQRGCGRRSHWGISMSRTAHLAGLRPAAGRRRRRRCHRAARHRAVARRRPHGRLRGLRALQPLGRSQLHPDARRRGAAVADRTRAARPDPGLLSRRPAAREPEAAAGGRRTVPAFGGQCLQDALPRLSL